MLLQSHKDKTLFFSQLVCLILRLSYEFGMLEQPTVNFFEVNTINII